jgi:hypothetical protein
MSPLAAIVMLEMDLVTDQITVAGRKGQGTLPSSNERDVSTKTMSSSKYAQPNEHHRNVKRSRECEDDVTERTFENDEDDDSSLEQERGISSQSSTSVQINEAANIVHLVPTRSAYSKQERQGIWYSIEELATLKQQCIQSVIRRFHQSQKKLLNADDDDDDAGLEIYAATPNGKARQRRLQHVVQCVLQEQYTLRQVMDIVDADALRHVSHVQSRQCVKGARQRALTDLAAIDQELQRIRVCYTTRALLNQKQQRHPDTSSPAMYFMKRMLFDE